MKQRLSNSAAGIILCLTNTTSCSMPYTSHEARVKSMNFKLWSMVIPTILLLIGCTSVGPHNSLGHHAILGSTYGWSDDITEVVTDIRIDDLRIRRVRVSDSYCLLGYSEHIELDGPIGPDSSEIVDRLLSDIPICMNLDKELPAVPKTVYLNSQGGHLADGYRMGEIFQSNKARTIITEKQVCASACAIAFLGGMQRYMLYDARLIFHAPYIDTGIGIECADDKQATPLRAYLVDKLGKNNGEFVLQRTMSYCSADSGWTLNSDAATLFDITTPFR